MNERIKELMKEANKDITLGKPFWSALEEFSEKFAELIVRECLDIASQEDFDVMMKEGYPCSQTAKKIKEHFGVDE
jgi:hypothetical protein